MLGLSDVGQRTNKGWVDLYRRPGGGSTILPIPQKTPVTIAAGTRRTPENRGMGMSGQEFRSDWDGPMPKSHAKYVRTPIEPPPVFSGVLDSEAF